jgi:guanylate kinase
MPSGKLLILIGPPGAGKDSLTTLLTAATPFYKYPSGTTRAMRPGESQFYPYTFYTQREYQQLRQEGGLFNDIPLGADNYFLQIEVFDRVAAGDRIVLHLVYPWAIKVKERLPNTKLVLVVPPDEAAQRARMASRGDDPTLIDTRIANAEMQQPPADGDYDLVIVNQTGQLNRAASELMAFLGSA